MQSLQIYSRQVTNLCFSDSSAFFQAGGHTVSMSSSIMFTGANNAVFGLSAPIHYVHKNQNNFPKACGLIIHGKGKVGV